jgi:hypothetical protein
MLRTKIPFGFVLVMGAASQGDPIDRMRSRPGPRLAMVKLQKIARTAATAGCSYERAALAISFRNRAAYCSWNLA